MPLEEADAELPARKPMRAIFTRCCASAAKLKTGSKAHSANNEALKTQQILFLSFVAS